MEGIAEMGGSKVGLVNVVAVSLVDDDGISHLHDAALDPLQFVACPSQLDEEEEVYHRVYCRLTLPHTDGLDEDRIEASGLAEYDRLHASYVATPPSEPAEGRGAGT